MPQALAFISHSSKDKQIATQLAQCLRARAIDVWIDHEQIRFGDSVPGKIAEGLNRCDAILVLVSSSFVTSSWCRSEYEPLLTREINEKRSVVIPLRLDDAQVPVLLSAKRYADLRQGLTESMLDELAETIAYGRSFATVRRLTPNKAPSFECSLLAMIISSVIRDYPVTQITNSEILAGRSLIDLYRTIESLIGRYEDVCDEILRVLEESEIRDHFFGSAGRISQTRLLSANRRLNSIAKDMREISSTLDALLPVSSRLRERFSALLELCVSISVAEDFLVLQLGAPITLPVPPEASDITAWRIWQQSPGLPVSDNVLAPYYFGDLGEKMIGDFTRVLNEIHLYRGELRTVVARLTSASGA